jgi:HK97 family phage prohead protease
MKTLAERKAPLTRPFAVKSVDEEARTFSGLASTWDLDLGNDVIELGAFKRTLNAWRSSGRVLPLIDNHNYGSVRAVVGKMLSAQETTEGLECDFEVIEGPDGDEVLRRVKGGYVDGLSIGYEAVKWEMERAEGTDAWDAIRHLKEIKLREVSVVIWPMNPHAVIDTTSVKALAEALREGRLSEEEQAELKALPAETRKNLRALLEDESAPAVDDPAPPAETPPGPAPTDAKLEGVDLDRLRLRLLLRTVKLRGPATRNGPARHAVSS